MRHGERFTVQSFNRRPLLTEWQQPEHREYPGPLNVVLPVNIPPDPRDHLVVTVPVPFIFDVLDLSDHI